MIPELRRRLLGKPAASGPAYIQFTSNGTFKLDDYGLDIGDTATVLCIGWGGGKGGTHNNGGGGNGGNGWGGGNGGNGGNYTANGAAGTKAGEAKIQQVTFNALQIPVTIGTAVNKHTTFGTLVTGRSAYVNGQGQGGVAGIDGEGCQCTCSYYPDHDYWQDGGPGGGGGGGAGAAGWQINYTNKTVSRAKAWNPVNGGHGQDGGPAYCYDCDCTPGDYGSGGKGAPNNSGIDGQNGDKMGAGICVIWPDY